MKEQSNVLFIKLKEICVEKLASFDKAFVYSIQSRKSIATLVTR